MRDPICDVYVLSLNSTWLVTSRLDTTRRVRRVEPVELVVSSVSSSAVRQARHSQNAWARHVLADQLYFSFDLLNSTFDEATHLAGGPTGLTGYVYSLRSMFMAAQ